MIRNKLKAQTFNDGTVQIYSVTNSAAPGDMPTDGLTLKETLRYEERTVGITRYHSGLQSNYRVDMLLRCQRRPDITTEMVAIPNDGRQYDIKRIQYPEDVVPPVMDLELMRRVENYAID